MSGAAVIVGRLAWEWAPFHQRRGLILRCADSVLNGMFFGWSHKEAAAALAAFNTERREGGFAEVRLAG